MIKKVLEEKYDDNKTIYLEPQDEQSTENFGGENTEEVIIDEEPVDE